MLAVSAYLTWLSRGSEVGRNPSWRGQNAIAAAALIPVERLDPRKGEAIYGDRCVSCHGADGQGVQIGDKKAGPLWGPGSWNDGAGAARVYTLAGMIRYTMPYLDPGNMTDEDAQQLAAFINSKRRPAFPFKDRDYREGETAGGCGVLRAAIGSSRDDDSAGGVTTESGTRSGIARLRERGLANRGAFPVRGVGSVRFPTRKSCR